MFFITPNPAKKRVPESEVSLFSPTSRKNNTDSLFARHLFHIFAAH
jgi:hypothetical protein